MNTKTNSPTLTVSNSGTSSGTWISGTYGSFSSSSTTVTSIGGSFSSGVSSGISYIGYSSVVSTVKYVVLGKEIEVNGYKDPVTALYISMINLQGKTFYDEVKKQGVDFPKEIEEYLKIALIQWEREKKLDTLL
jgi:hypothetical protein